MVKAETPTTEANKKPRAVQPAHSPVTNAKKKSNESTPLNPKTPNSLFPDSGIRRSTRAKPILDGVWSALESNEGEEDEEEDERELKKQKLVQRLKSEPVSLQNSRSSQVLVPRSNGQKVQVLMERIGDGDGSEAKDRSGNASKETNAANKVLEKRSGPTTALPDKKTILFILDRLQKKDTHGVFSEPVDPEELPDYHEIIENPMDFSTVRKKLDDGLYQTLEQFEEDIFLICSNAMQYNSPSTVYFRKARTIQELARRDFDNLRQKGEDGEPQPRVIRRGRPPKSVEKSPEQAATQIPSSDSPNMAFGSVSENSKNYNLRKGLSANKYITDETMLMGIDEPSSVGLQEWNTEFPASILKAPYGKRPVVVDESRRETYRQPVASAELPTTNMLMMEPKRLLPVGVGLTEKHVYPSSLARFAAGLGPVAWGMALKKISSLGLGVEFDPSHFAYESPKFPIYEVDANLEPIIPTTNCKPNNGPTQTYSNCNDMGARMETANSPRPNNNLNRAYDTSLAMSVDSISGGSSQIKHEQLEPNRIDRAV